MCSLNFSLCTRAANTHRHTHTSGAVFLLIPLAPPLSLFLLCRFWLFDLSVRAHNTVASLQIISRWRCCSRGALRRRRPSSLLQFTAQSKWSLSVAAFCAARARRTLFRSRDEMCICVLVVIFALAPLFSLCPFCSAFASLQSSKALIVGRRLARSSAGCRRRCCTTISFGSRSLHFHRARRKFFDAAAAAAALRILNLGPPYQQAQAELS